MVPRRKFLASSSFVAVCLAGCNASTTTESGKEEPRYGVILEDSPNHPLKLEVEVIQPFAQLPDEPLRLFVSIDNVTDEKLRYSEQRRTTFLNASDQGFTLAGSGRPHTFNETRNVWVADSLIQSTSMWSIGEILPGDTHSEERILIGKDMNDTPDTVPEEFQFNTSFKVERSNTPNWTDATSYEWGFTLRHEE